MGTTTRAAEVFAATRRRLLFLVAEDWYFWSHRGDLARAAREAGWDVSVATRVVAHGERIQSEGFRLIPIGLSRASRHPAHELRAVAELVALYRRERPHLVHHIAMKPILYGSVAARVTHVPCVVNAFMGFGYTMVSEGGWAKLRRRSILSAMRVALSFPNGRVILQNQEDLEQCINAGVVARKEAVLIRGSGVDLSRFQIRPEPNEPIVVLASRMLRFKGIGEFVEAANILRDRGTKARFVLVGGTDPQNPASYTDSELTGLTAAGNVEWWGHRDNMPEILSSAQVVALPSYGGEGVPKVLLEAAACARPIVTTDVRGCREVVRDGENGLLVPPKSGLALANAIGRLLEDRAERARMSARGREIVAREFSSEQIAKENLAVYDDLWRAAQ